MSVFQELFDAHDASETAAAHHASASRELLRHCGWKLTCDTPGCLWMWQRTMPDGRTLLVDEETALKMEVEKFWDENPPDEGDSE